MGYVFNPRNWKRYIFHRGFSRNFVHIGNGLIPGGKEKDKARQAVFLTPTNPFGHVPEQEEPLSSGSSGGDLWTVSQEPLAGPWGSEVHPTALFSSRRESMSNSILGLTRKPLQRPHCTNVLDTRHSSPCRAPRSVSVRLVTRTLKGKARVPVTQHLGPFVRLTSECKLLHQNCETRGRRAKAAESGKRHMHDLRGISTTKRRLPMCAHLAIFAVGPAKVFPLADFGTLLRDEIEQARRVSGTENWTQLLHHSLFQKLWNGNIARGGKRITRWSKTEKRWVTGQQSFQQHIIGIEHQHVVTMDGNC